MKLAEMIAASRVELIEPRAQKPSYRYLLNIAVAVVQSAFNRLTNTGRSWAVGETTLAVVSGQDEYSLGVSGMGKVLDVVAVTDSETLTETQIPFYDLADLADGGWSYGTDARIAFFRKNGLDTLWAKVRPIPTASQDYTVRYSIGEWAADLDSSPLLSMHHHLFVAQIARDALAAAEWSMDAKADAFKRDALDKSLSRRIDNYQRDFDLYIAAVNVPRMTHRLEAYPIE